MTVIEWIELAQDRIENSVVADYRFNNIKNIDEALKYLNKAKILLNEHQYGLPIKNEESLTTK